MVTIREGWKAGRLEGWKRVSYQAILGTPRTERWLARTKRAQVVHVFERACNLVNEGGEILSLVSSKGGIGPFGLVVDEHDPGFDTWISPQTEVSVEPEGLRIGDRQISLRSVENWNPRPGWDLLRFEMDSCLDNLSLLEGILKTHAPESSLAELLPWRNGQAFLSKGEAGNRIAPGWAEVAREPAAALSEGILNQDEALVIRGASDLGGLGAGLTPAGDDFLMGAIYAAWLMYPDEDAENLAAMIAKNAARRTNQLSAAWLQAAANGEAGMRWHKLFASLAGEKRSDLEPAARDLLASGHTSGADGLSGFVATLNLYKSCKHS